MTLFPVVQARDIANGDYFLRCCEAGLESVLASNLSLILGPYSTLQAIEGHQMGDHYCGAEGIPHFKELRGLKPQRSLVDMR